VDAFVVLVAEALSFIIRQLHYGSRAPSRSRKPLRLAYESLQLASRRVFYGGSISYGGLRQNGE